MDDGEIVRKAKAILRSSPYRDLQNVKISMDSGTLVLSGVVPSFYHKQLAFESLNGEFNGTPVKTKDIKVKEYS